MVVICSGFNFVERLDQKSSFFFVVAGLLAFKLYCFISYAESKIGVEVGSVRDGISLAFEGVLMRDR